MAVEVGIPFAVAIVPGLAATLLATLAARLLPGAQLELSALDLPLPLVLAATAATAVIALLTANVFARARDAGLRAVPHGGEGAGPESVRACVERLGASRVNHTGYGPRRVLRSWTCWPSAASASTCAQRRTSR